MEESLFVTKYECVPWTSNYPCANKKYTAVKVRLIRLLRKKEKKRRRNEERGDRETLRPGRIKMLMKGTRASSTLLFLVLARSSLSFLSAIGNRNNINKC